jgi:hypothetical protein
MPYLVCQWSMVPYSMIDWHLPSVVTDHIGRASEGRGGDETVGRGAFQFRFQNPAEKPL